MPKPNRLADDKLAEDEWDTYATIGEFFIAFSAAEHTITSLLALMVQAKSAEQFELVARGMDARVKCERLQAALKLDGSAVGPNIKKRIDAFLKTVLRKRNELAHRWVSVDENKKHRIHLASLSKPPSGPIKPPHIKREELTTLTYWLATFRSDLADAYLQLKKTGTFETNDPLSNLPPEAVPPEIQAKILASFGKPPQTQT